MNSPLASSSAPQGDVTHTSGTSSVTRASMDYLLASSVPVRASGEPQKAKLCVFCVFGKPDDVKKHGLCDGWYRHGGIVERCECYCASASPSDDGAKQPYEPILVGVDWASGKDWTVKKPARAAASDDGAARERERLASWLDHLAGVQANLPLTLTLDERAHLKLAARLLRGGLPSGE